LGRGFLERWKVKASVFIFSQSGKKPVGDPKRKSKLWLLDERWGQENKNRGPSELGSLKGGEALEKKERGERFPGDSRASCVS